MVGIGCSVVLTHSVVADGREAHSSMGERRSESLPYCAVTAHAFQMHKRSAAATQLRCLLLLQ